MSTLATAPDATAPSRPARRMAGPSFFRVLAAEAIKVRTVLSTPILLACAIALMVGFAALQAWGIGSFKEAAENDPEAAAAFARQGAGIFTTIPTAGVSFAQLIIGSLAVLLMSSEFATGLSRATFAAVPKRQPVFAAKALLGVVIGFAVAYIGAFVGGLVAVPIASQYGISLDLAAWEVQRNILLNGLYVVAVVLMGIALGTLLRNSAGAIVTLVAVLFVLPIIAQIIPGEFFEEVRKYLPTNAASAMLQWGADVTPEQFLEPWQGALLLGGYVVVLMAGAAFSLSKRDV